VNVSQVQRKTRDLTPAECLSEREDKPSIPVQKQDFISLHVHVFQMSVLLPLKCCGLYTPIKELGESLGLQGSALVEFIKEQQNTARGTREAETRERKGKRESSKAEGIFAGRSS